MLTSNRTVIDRGHKSTVLAPYCHSLLCPTPYCVLSIPGDTRISMHLNEPSVPCSSNPMKLMVLKGTGHALFCLVFHIFQIIACFTIYAVFMPLKIDGEEKEYRPKDKLHGVPALLFGPVNQLVPVACCLEVKTWGSKPGLSDSHCHLRITPTISSSPILVTVT